MKALFFDHFFHQDIGALFQAASGRGHELKVLDYSEISKPANQVFPKSAFQGLENAFREELEPQRQQWAEVSRQLFSALHERYPFDVFISPSDTFFYLRDFIRIGQERGVPTVVVQKETAVAPNAFESHAAEVKRLLPVMCDHMCVCSEDQREFWLKSGGKSENISITGQPRFDVYFHPEMVPSWNAMGIPIPSNKPVLLFLSYNLNTYAPEDLSTYYASGISKGPNDGPWRQLRDETEEVLFQLADCGYMVLVKPHPQQDTSEYIPDFAQRAAGRMGNTIHFVSAQADTRNLVANCDVLVGFQTTALFEGMLAKKEVIYTGWTEPVLQSREGLMEFHRRPDALKCANSPEELFRFVKGARKKVDDENVILARQRFLQNYLGKCDGESCNRVWSEIERVVSSRRNSNLAPSV
ncbi:MAG: CDP-glycerol glycerophosphotransferase family protein [Bdellovibrionales bacterium]|nr:CDP-glycerol glycerophosphotransferase family protein [Bdellovibrionales bacterium]